MNIPIIGLIGNLDNYHVKCDMLATSDRLMTADTLSLMLPYTKNLCKPTANEDVVGYKDIMKRRQFQLSKCDEILVINSGGDIPYLIQIEITYAKDVLNKRITYLYGGCQNAYDNGNDPYIKIWNSGYPYYLKGCKIIDKTFDMGVKKAPIDPPPIDPELMDKVDPTIINCKALYKNTKSQGIIVDGKISEERLSKIISDVFNE